MQVSRSCQKISCRLNSRMGSQGSTAVICRERGLSYFEVINAPCGDDYCKDCLQSLFESSYTDEDLFPLRCCRHVIPLATASIFLTRTQQERYEPRRIEVSTTDRTYCSETSCNKFILPSTFHNHVGTCDCQTLTCSRCKRAAHDGLCGEDETLQQTLDLAQQEGWRRCGRCTRMIELTVGCNHMT